jgi:hypothetical protein
MRKSLIIFALLTTAAGWLHAGPCIARRAGAAAGALVADATDGKHAYRRGHRRPGRRCHLRRRDGPAALLLTY